MTTPHTAKQKTIWGEWQLVEAAPEPPEWIEDEQPVDVEAIEEEERQYMYMLAEEDAEREYMYSIEDDHEAIIAHMMGH